MPIVQRLMTLSEEMTVGDMIIVLSDYYMGEALRGASYPYDLPRRYHLAYVEMLGRRTTEELRAMIRPLIEMYPGGYHLPI